MECLIYIDGGARGNPGPAAAGVSITTPDGSEAIYEAGFWLGKTTNNEAEYQGLLYALREASKRGMTRPTIRSDSQLMVRQISGEYRVKAENLKPLYQQAIALLQGFESWAMVHVKRDKNKRADQLANMAMDAGQHIVAFDSAEPQSS